jgi:perosamine synthetase
MTFIPQMEPSFDEAEARALYDYMQSGGWVTEHSKTREFEAAIAECTGARYCSVVSNGTVSLTLALIACGVGRGDEVLVPDYTMIATANAVRLAGAEVVFADINLDTLCIDQKTLEAAITPNTKAAMMVTINGRFPQELEQLVQFCRGRGIHVIEDAAQSLGSRKGERHLGTFGDIGSFSFSAPKVITTGQGGALITNDDTLIDRIRKLRDFGRERGGGDDYLTMGWNFKFTDIQAVIGLEQMKKLPWRVQRKKEMFAMYRQGLANTPTISFIPTDLGSTSPWFVDIRVHGERRDELARYLNSQGIGARPFYPALHSTPVYSRAESYPNAERVAREGLWLPSSSRLTDEQIAFVIDRIQSFT